MKIAVISVHGCPCIPPGGTDAGGMNVYVHETSCRLGGLGHDVTVFARRHEGAKFDVADLVPQYGIEHVKAGPIALVKDELPSTLDEFTDIVTGLAARDADGFDVIASHYWLSGVVAAELSRRWHIPHITSFHTIGQMKIDHYSGSSESEVRIESERRIARSADKIVAWTDAEARFISSRLGADLEKIEVVPPGIDTERFRPSAQGRVGADMKPAAPAIIFVGRLDALKGVDLLIESMAIIRSELPDAKLSVIGGGTDEEMERVQSLARACGVSDRVDFLGVRPQEELPSRYSAADVIVAPSFHETFGLAVLEAESCGTPAVAADVDGLRSIVMDGVSGYLVRGRSPRRYAERVLEILKHRELREAMSRAARRRARALSWEVTVTKLAAIYEEVAAKRDEQSAVPSSIPGLR